MINVSTSQGPIGPPGYNGTQGPPGDSGSGGVSLCSYKETKSPTISAGSYARSEVSATETNVGRKTLTQSDQDTIRHLQTLSRKFL